MFRIWQNFTIWSSNYPASYGFQIIIETCMEVVRNQYLMISCCCCCCWKFSFYIGKQHVKYLNRFLKKVRETASKISKTLKSQEKRHFGLKLTWRAGIWVFSFLSILIILSFFLEFINLKNSWKVGMCCSKIDDITKIWT